MSFSHDSIEEPPLLPLRHSTGSTGSGGLSARPVSDDPFATTDFAESGLLYTALAAPAVATTTRANRNPLDDDDESETDDDDDDDKSASSSENTEDTEEDDAVGNQRQRQQQQEDNSGVMRARDAAVLESASSLKWSTGEIQAPTSPARHTAPIDDLSASNTVSSSSPARSRPPASAANSADGTPPPPAAAAAAAAADDGAVSWRIDPHEVQMIKEIGRGSFGAVYTAKLRGSDVAVKKLYSTTSDAGILADFSAEVSIMTKLRHPHVLLFMGASSQPGALFIVFEYMPRGSVYDVLHDPVIGPRLTFAAKMDIARQTAQGMNWLHLSKPPFLHRDLKTGNLLIDNNWTVKVCDFGLSQVKKATPPGAAQHAAAGDSDGTRRSNPVLLGTPLWMAPEILSGASAEPDESADVYAFGIVLWEIITRQEPYPEVQSFDELVELVVVRNERPRFPPDTPQSLVDLAGQCWHTSRSQRPTFADILLSLADVVIDGVLLDARACRFWKKRFYEHDTVSWKAFRDNLAAELKIQPRANDVAWRCLLALIAVAGGGAEAVQREKHGIGSGAALRRAVSASTALSPTGSNVASVAVACMHDPDDELVVHMADFGRLLQYIGPLDSHFLETAEALLRKRWFWGDVPTAQAELLVQKAGKGAYLVRFSTSDVGSFTITVQSKSGRTKHFRILHKGNEFTLGQQTRRSIFELVEDFGNELYMQQPVPDSPFQSLFTQKSVDTVAMSAYFDADLSGINNSYQ